MLSNDQSMQAIRFGPQRGGRRWRYLMKMKLYEFAPSRSLRVRWTLQELGVDYEFILDR
jgi:hypothetical protein